MSYLVLHYKSGPVLLADELGVEQYHRDQANIHDKKMFVTPNERLVAHRIHKEGK